MIYLGTYKPIDVYEGDWATDNEANLLGTYSSGMEVITVTNYEYTTAGEILDDESGAKDSMEYTLGGTTQNLQADATVTYRAVITEDDGTTHTKLVTVVQMTNGDTFLKELNGDASSSLDNLEISSIELVSVDYEDYSGHYTAGSIKNTTVCFRVGTRVATPDGARAVEELQTGDLVETCDRGAQPIGWIGQTNLNKPKMAQAPIKITAGALGPGYPVKTLWVSPNHRILLRNRIAQRMFGTADVLIPAKRLTALPGISQPVSNKPVTYYHLALAKHGLLLANGAWSESFYPGPMALASLGPSHRQAVFKLFRGRVGPIAPGLARYQPCGGKQNRLIERLVLNQRNAFSPSVSHPRGRIDARRVQVGKL